MTGALPANPFPGMNPYLERSGHLAEGICLLSRVGPFRSRLGGCRYSASRVFPMGLERLGQGAPRLCRGLAAASLRRFCARVLNKAAA